MSREESSRAATSADAPWRPPSDGLAEELARKNREVYDETDGAVWRLAVFGELHQGWEFINMGGQPLLDSMARRVGLAPGRRMLELCCGRGAPCAYLAERYGCQATGVELNPRQVARALELRRRLPPEVAARLRFVEANVLEYRPEEPFDVVLSVDSLTLLGDLRLLLRRAVAALVPGGWFAAATIAAGRRLDDETRRLVWEMDGMISLEGAARYGALLEEAGFADFGVEDAGHLALAFSEEIVASLRRHEAAIVDSEGEESYRGWLEGSLFYLEAFREERLSYLLPWGRKAR